VQKGNPPPARAVKYNNHQRIEFLRSASPGRGLGGTGTALLERLPLGAAGWGDSRSPSFGVGAGKQGNRSSSKNKPGGGGGRTCFSPRPMLLWGWGRSTLVHKRAGVDWPSGCDRWGQRRRPHVGDCRQRFGRPHRGPFLGICTEARRGLAWGRTELRGVSGRRVGGSPTPPLGPGFAGPGGEQYRGTGLPLTWGRGARGRLGTKKEKSLFVGG